MQQGHPNVCIHVIHGCTLEEFLRVGGVRTTNLVGVYISVWKISQASLPLVSCRWDTTVHNLVPASYRLWQRPQIYAAIVLTLSMKCDVNMDLNACHHPSDSFPRSAPFPYWNAARRSSPSHVQRLACPSTSIKSEIVSSSPPIDQLHSSTHEPLPVTCSRDSLQTTKSSIQVESTHDGASARQLLQKVSSSRSSILGFWGRTV